MKLYLVSDTLLHIDAEGVEDLIESCYGKKIPVEFLNQPVKILTSSEAYTLNFCNKDHDQNTFSCLSQNRYCASYLNKLKQMLGVSDSDILTVITDTIILSKGELAHSYPEIKAMVIPLSVPLVTFLSLLHELGHIFGLTEHCYNPGCIMNSDIYSTIYDLFKYELEHPTLCNQCTEKLEKMLSDEDETDY